MKNLLLALIVFLVFSLSVVSQQVDFVRAENAVQARLVSSGMDGTCMISNSDRIHDSNGSVLFFLFHLSPKGYMIISGEMELPPVIAYSFTDHPDKDGRLISLVRADLTFRLQGSSEAVKNRNRLAWERIRVQDVKSVLFQQWPEPGTTLTGGWLETNWTQSSPYNLLCPMDLVTGVRSIAGCPAVAMAQIVNFHQTINGVHFTDEDDYYHSYAGRNFTIDDDYLQVDFPSFPMLNGYLDTLQISYDNGTTLKNRDKAALTFACGVAARQVFTSSASGTFGVDQALDAYLKFNFQDVDLLDENDTTLYARMAQNIKDTLPVHLAVVDPAWSMGHNVVVDGYNTDEYFHLNFGWGGPSNGWYQLPEEIPYGLTVIEGAVVDIIPDFPTGMSAQHTTQSLFFPNPARDNLNFATGNHRYSKASIYSFQGQLVRTIILDNTSSILDISDLSEGMYFIRLLGEQGFVSGKVVICR